MGRKPYSTDLRERVVAEVASGTSRRRAAARFKVSISSAIRWAELQDKTGSVKPRPRKGQRSPLAPHSQWLLDLNAKEGDLTGAEIVRRIFDELGLVTSESAVRRFFKRHRISFKKNTARRRARPA
jgi:transposase